MKKDWKTTLFGLLAAAMNLYANGITGKQLLVSLGVLGLGAAAGDGQPKQ